MYGYGKSIPVSFTAQTTGDVLVLFSGAVTNSVSADGGTVTIQYGTGTAPVHMGGLTGTSVVNSLAFGAPSSLALFPFTLAGYASGLVLGTPYWFDLAGEALVTGV